MQSRRRRGAWCGAAMLALTLALGGVAAAPAPQGNVLLVDNERTANPNLIATALTIPANFSLAPHTLALPPGYSASVVAAGIAGPRFMAFDAEGNLLVAAQEAGAVYRYPAAAGVIAPAPAPPPPLISGLNAPSNVALFTVDGQDYLYVGETNQVARYAYDASGPVGSPDVIIPNLPTDGHLTRTVVFGPDGMLYLSVGSSCNICVEHDPLRATISRANPDGSGLSVIATGLRNAVGLAFEPGTDLLWATVNERDYQGDEIPPDLVTVITPGADYGWPICIPPNATPQEPGDDCSHITPPTIGIQAHSAPLGLTFVAGDRAPRDLAGDLIVAQHGSWNRQPPSPPKLLWIEFDNGAPKAARDFATGWQDANGNRWGRPAGVIMAPDGSLIVSDDAAGMLYRIALSE